MKREVNRNDFLWLMLILFLLPGLAEYREKAEV